MKFLKNLGITFLIFLVIGAFIVSIVGTIALGQWIAGDLGIFVGMVIWAIFFVAAVFTWGTDPGYQ